MENTNKRNEVGNDNHNDDDVNVIINYRDLISFMTCFTVCKKCKTSLTEECFHRTSCGLATNIFYTCKNNKCNYRHCIRPELVKKNNKWKDMIEDDDDNSSNDDNDKKMKNPNENSIDSYTINIYFILWLQQFGLSATAARQLASSLCLTKQTKLFHDFTELEEKIALNEIILSKMIIDDNVAKEMAVSPVDEKGKSELTVTMDAGWNNRGSGRSYNSSSCQHVVYGARTNKIVALHTMSRECVKCSQKKTSKNSVLEKC